MPLHASAEPIMEEILKRKIQKEKDYRNYQLRHSKFSKLDNDVINLIKHIYDNTRLPDYRDKDYSTIINELKYANLAFILDFDKFEKILKKDLQIEIDEGDKLEALDNYTRNYNSRKKQYIQNKTKKQKKKTVTKILNNTIRAAKHNIIVRIRNIKRLVKIVKNKQKKLIKNLQLINKLYKDQDIIELPENIHNKIYSIYVPFMFDITALKDELIEFLNLINVTDRNFFNNLTNNIEAIMKDYYVRPITSSINKELEENMKYTIDYTFPKEIYILDHILIGRPEVLKVKDYYNYSMSPIQESSLDSQKSENGLVFAGKYRSKKTERHQNRHRHKKRHTKHIKKRKL